MMPVLDGWAVLKELRANPSWSKIPVVLLTAAGDKARFAKTTAVLKKPIELNQLLNLTERFCAPKKPR
jgi:CheY-like chemotaxis protein